MITIQSNFNAFFDVDDTLILNENVCNPHIKVEMPGATCTDPKRIHWGHVRLLKSYKEKGYTIFVWSHNGAKHCENIIKLLELENYVDYCLSKPIKTVDDKTDLQSIVGMLIYIPEGN